MIKENEARAKCPVGPDIDELQMAPGDAPQMTAPAEGAQQMAPVGDQQMAAPVGDVSVPASAGDAPRGIHIIGFYNYTVILTYISLAFSVIGMTQAIQGRFKTAVSCLALSGLCDMFDGKIARSKKDRTEDMKAFGIQIDSLCDVVCFGAFPAMICYLLGVRGPLGLAVIVLYCINSVIRLGFFNVMEGRRQQETEDERKYYRGLPITSMAVVLPLIFMTQFFVSDFVFIILLHGALLLVGILFVVDFRFKKPGRAMQAVMVIVVGIALIIMIIYINYRIFRRPLNVLR